MRIVLLVMGQVNDKPYEVASANDRFMTNSNPTHERE